MTDELKRLIDYRYRNRLTLKRLAEKLEVSMGSLTVWLSGRGKPSKMNMYHIQRLLDKDGE